MGSLGTGYASYSLEATVSLTSYMFLSQDSTLCHYNVSCAPGTTPTCGNGPLATPIPKTGVCLQPYLFRAFVNFYDPNNDISLPCNPVPKQDTAEPGPQACR